MKAGDFTARIQLRRHDELGVLIDHHNALAATLEAADNAERQWITDTSHELQTPLANLRAEIEAIQDGVRKPTESVIASLHASVMRLSRLVGDLNTLSRTREGALAIQPQWTNISGTIEAAVAEANRLLKFSPTDNVGRI